MAIPPDEEEQTDAADTDTDAEPLSSSSSLYRCSPTSSVDGDDKDDHTDAEFEIIFQHPAAEVVESRPPSWEDEEEAMLDAGVGDDFDDVFVDGDDVSSLYHSSSRPHPQAAGGASSLPNAEEVRSWAIHLLDGAPQKTRGGKGGYLEEDEEQTSDYSTRRRRTPLIVAGCVFLVMTMIGLIAGFVSQSPRAAAVGQNNAGNGDDLNHDDTAADNNDAPRRSSYSQVKDYVVQHGISSLHDFQDIASSPQAHAAAWMANVDAANLPVPAVYDDDDLEQENDANDDDDDDDDDDDYYLARYAMAVLYFATNGEHWHQQFNFLTKGNVCTWKGEMMDTSGTKAVPYGVDCDENGTIRGLYLGM
jgi:hypothetical protein